MCVAVNTNNSVFSDEIVERVIAHMNDDHMADSLLIAKANGFADAIAAKMTGLDENAGFWQVTSAAGEHQLRVAWPGGKISQRPEIRREVVALYEQAAAALGVDVSRETSAHEHDSENAHHGGAGHAAHAGHGHHGHGADPQTTEYPEGEKPFSVVIRESSWGAHSDSEGADFMANIMRGIAPLADYEELVAQHYPLYVALEEAAESLAGSEVTANFDVPELRRVAALERDLEHLWGSQWREKIVPVAATQEYVARIKELVAAGDLPGIVAQHYTRYLGDLSGGQMIARRMRKQHGFESDGVAFYEFAELGDLAEFKRQYRAWLDMLGESLDDGGKERFLAEVQRAYDYNTRIFIELAARKSQVAA